MQKTDCCGLPNTSPSSTDHCPARTTNWSCTSPITQSCFQTKPHHLNSAPKFLISIFLIRYFPSHMPTPLPFLMFHPHMTSNHLLPHKASNFSYLQYHLLNLFATISQKSSKFSFLPHSILILYRLSPTPHFFDHNCSHTSHPACYHHSNCLINIPTVLNITMDLAFTLSLTQSHTLAPCSPHLLDFLTTSYPPPHPFCLFPDLWWPNTTTPSTLLNTSLQPHASLYPPHLPSHTPSMLYASTMPLLFDPLPRIIDCHQAILPFC